MIYNVSMKSKKGVVFVAKRLAVVGAGASGIISAIEAKIETLICFSSFYQSESLSKPL